MDLYGLIPEVVKAEVAYRREVAGAATPSRKRRVRRVGR